MISSMTGFGRGTASADGADVTVELRSLNGRYADVSVRAPRSLAEHEAEIQSRVKDALDRGKISVSVQAQRAAVSAPLRVDAAAAAAYRQLLDRVREAAGIAEPVGLEHVLRFPDVLVAVETEDEAEGVWEATQAALAEALEAHLAMRRQEGDALAADLRARLGAIETELDAVEADAPARIVAARAAMHERIADLLGDERLDRDRLELEIALLADRLDVNEECVRLRSHLALFREALGSDEPVGRRLNFLAQEFNREINTIASKAGDPGIAHRAVTMKEELEKIREQVQNVV
ncbi:MAG: YicC/YloC family endoribonuclease [Bacteroidota bacterium]